MGFLKKLEIISEIINLQSRKNGVIVLNFKAFWNNCCLIISENRWLTPFSFLDSSRPC